MTVSRQARAGGASLRVIGLLALALVAAAGLWWARRSPVIEPGARAPLTLFVLGGSTAEGEPYVGRADLGLVARWFLGDEVGGRPVEVVNRGGPGKPSGAVVEDARAIASEPHEPGTAVALLYLGNNEFLAFDDRHDLSGVERALFDEPLLAPEAMETVFQRYSANIEEIVRVLQGAGVHVIAATIAVNMKDWEPNRSVLRDPAQREAVERGLAEGERELAAGRVEAALAAYLAVLELEPDFALASKKAGDCLRRLGRTGDARVRYQQAVDHDANPYRETSRQNELLRAVCARFGVPVVDAVALLEAGSPDGLIGFELMWDNCHPTLEGYARIALGFVAEIEAALGVRRRRTELDLAALERDLGFDDAFRCQVSAGRGQYCYAASSLTFDPRARLERAEQYLEQALALAPEDASLLCSFAVLDAMKGDTEGSLAHWREAYRLDPRGTKQRARHPHVREIMQRRGIEDLPSLLK